MKDTDERKRWYDSIFTLKQDKERKLESCLVILQDINNYNGSVSALVENLTKITLDLEMMYLRDGRQSEVETMYEIVSRVLKSAINKVDDPLLKTQIERIADFYVAKSDYYSKSHKQVEQEKYSESARKAKDSMDYDRSLYMSEKALERGKELQDKYAIINALYEKADALMKKSEVGAALPIYKELTERDPNGTAWFYVGYILGELGKLEESQQYYKKYVSVKPEDSNGWNNLSWTYIGLKDYNKALEYSKIALDKQPNNPEALLNSGSILNVLEKHEEALSYYDKALEINPNYVNALYNKGWTLGILGRDEEALSYYDKALEINPNDTDSLVNKIYELEVLGKSERFEYSKRLVEICEQMLAKDGQNTDAMTNLGSGLSNLGRYDEAQGWFDKALKINPNHGNATFNKAATLAQMGKDDEALELLEHAVALSPSLKPYASKEKSFEKLRQKEEFKKIIR